MATFIKENFLLESSLAEQLYYDVAKDLPIIDYHNHLSPQLICNNHQFKDLTSIWLDGDHYKWRAMRTIGVEEKYITGDASAKDKFTKWASTVPHTIRNPLFHWTHMELNNPFNISKLLNPHTAEEIYNETNVKLQQPEFSTQGLLNHYNVNMLGTTDDPTDNLEYHAQLKEQTTFKCKVKPSFRPDKVFALTNKDIFRAYITKLSEVSNININDLESLEEALAKRIIHFNNLGCVASDHGLKQIPKKNKYSKIEINNAFKEVINGNDDNASVYEESYTYYLLIFLSKKYHEHNWAQQFHLGALRNTNTHKLSLLGPDTGYDTIGDYPQAENIATFLNELEQSNQLTKTIIYNLNPSDNNTFAAMIGNFQGEGIQGKIQFGSAWWFLDQLDGMTNQINTLSNLGLISCFIGMLTDSRSFLSYSRHEYFRRLLCNIFANDINKGLLPNDKELINQTIQNICYYNAKNYFKE